MKTVCKECGYWTRNPAHDTYRCKMGDCPALQREKEDEYERFEGNCPTCGQKYLGGIDMQNGDEGQTEWEKEHRPALWLEYTWKKCQHLMREISEVLKDHPELNGTLDIPREEENEDRKPNG